VFVFKEIPTEKLLFELKQKGFKIQYLPQNPYLTEK
jgi:hypothetical protein